MRVPVCPWLYFHLAVVRFDYAILLSQIRSNLMETHNVLHVWIFQKFGYNCILTSTLNHDCKSQTTQWLLLVHELFLISSCILTLRAKRKSSSSPSPPPKKRKKKKGRRHSRSVSLQELLFSLHLFLFTENSKIINTFQKHRQKWWY